MKFGKNSGINRGRTRSVMNVLISELLHQVPGAHGSTCAFLVLRKTIIHDKSHFVLPSSSTMDDQNELISRDNSRFLQLFQQITFRRKYTAIQGQRKRRHGKAKRERYALSCLWLVWSGKKGKRPRFRPGSRGKAAPYGAAFPICDIKGWDLPLVTHCYCRRGWHDLQ